ncbi:hypothetical protein F5Y08DRAFT_307345 [Xylaria arbuscula]|nr:hypothetical protein F5Y08DRAFT_307345 [Xylaria arbuscula]
MPRSKPDFDFDIRVDTSCLNTPMDEEVPSASANLETNSEAPHQTPYSSASSSDGEVDPPISTEPSDMNSDAEKEAEAGDLHPSIEDEEDDVSESRAYSRASSGHDEEVGDHSMLSERTDLSFQHDDRGHSYVDHSESESDAIPREGDGDESSSHNGGTDEDVFTDKSPRSSMGSYDAGSESGKGVDVDNMTTITRSPRISDISQYDKEDFIPTARGTPRPPFRTPSDVRAMQMSSPAGSVYGSPRSPRSSKKQFPTVSRLGTPSASAQYSPKRKSTPPRFKSRQEAPLVLLHVTLLPLRWMWGDLVNNLDPVDMSEQAKTLRNSWRILQDRVGDTVVERGILLGHPQNDYEVLEERLLEALDLPVRRRARILECGHYLGPSNESTIIEEEESEDEYGKQQQQSSAPKRHWCTTCKSEIRYDSLGGDKVFRVKIYASNGLMRAGAWEACWKEMERVDVELEPMVEPSLQDEIVRLAAAQQEREIAQEQEEAEMAKEAASQYEEHRQSEDHFEFRSSPIASPEPIRPSRHGSRASYRRVRDERQRESYGQSPLPPESPPREPTPQPDLHAHSPSPSLQPAQQPVPQSEKQKEARRSEYQSATLPQLIWQSVRVLMQDRKNVVIFALSLFVLLLSVRSTPPEPYYEPIVHRLKDTPMIQRIPIANDPPARQEYSRSFEGVVRNEPSYSSAVYHSASQSQSSEPSTSSSSSSAEYQEEVTSESSMARVSSEPQSEPQSEPSQESSTSMATTHEPCQSAAESSPEQPAVSDIPAVQETVEEILEEVETVTEKKVVRVVHTVTETQIETQTQTEIQTEAESTTPVETVTPVEESVVEATETAQPEAELDLEDTAQESQNDAAPDETVSSEDALPTSELAENEEPVPEAVNESVTEPIAESVAEPVAESVAVTDETTVETPVETLVEDSLEDLLEDQVEVPVEHTVEDPVEESIEA